MFTDVNGSMNLSHSLDPGEWWSTMARLFELTCDGVYRFGGWVQAFTGDGVSAVFEAPAMASEHAQRACDAALWLRDQISILALQLHRARGFDLAVRIGINSGQILAGTIGGRYCRYYTASGYSVALAKRMESMAKAGCIYMTENTAALVGRGVIMRSLGPLEVKGAQAPVEGFELLGRAPETTQGVSGLDGSQMPSGLHDPPHSRHRLGTFWGPSTVKIQSI
jgi:adenylate cyclase